MTYWAVRHASRDLYDELLAGGVQIHEYQPTFIHAKSMVIDSNWSIIGSANMDNRSRKLNEEAVFGILNKDFGTKLEEFFSPTRPRRSKSSSRNGETRNLWYRAQELVARNFIEQY